MSLPISVREQALLLSAGKDNLRWANGGTAVFSVDKSVMIEGTVRPVEYHSYRHGKKFTYHFKGTGTYSIELGFAEINPEFCEGATRRIFTVLLNRQRLPSLTDVNVYKKVGCNRAFIETVTFPVAGDLFITFAASAADAMVSHIVVRRLQVDCVPASSNQGGITADHLAHAVPGEYPFIRSNTSPRSYVDANGDGFESVLINGDGSHSHFFDVVSKVSGRITRYEWTSPDTAEFLSQKVSFRFPFILGTTRIMLNVVDNLCSTDFAETSVTVTGSMVSGTYCYFYEGQTTLPGSGPADLEQKPSYSKGYTGTTWNFEALPFASSQFAAKCTFFLEVAEGVTQINGTISTKRSGRVSIYRGSEIALEDVRASPFSTSVAASLSSFEMVYVRDSFDQVPVVTLVVDSGTSHKVYHDRRTIFPVITSLQPPSSSTQGRRRVSIRVLGSSSKPKSVNVGDTVVPIAADSTASKVIFDVPASDAVGQVKISANWKGLIVSNALNFSYEIGPGKDPVEFAEVIMSEKNSERNAENGIATTIRIGPDGHIYLGTLNAEVVKLTYDMDTLTVTNRCGSYPLKDAKYSKDGVAAQRDILGMVFDPRDRFPRPYVSTQTLFYFYEGGRVDPNTTDAWANGAVDRLRPGRDRKNPYICLVHDKRIISGLPVSVSFFSFSLRCIFLFFVLECGLTCLLSVS